MTQQTQIATKLRKLAQKIEDAKIEGLFIVYVGDEVDNFSLLPQPNSPGLSMLIGEVNITLASLEHVAAVYRLQAQQTGNPKIPIYGSIPDLKKGN